MLRTPHILSPHLHISNCTRLSSGLVTVVRIRPIFYDSRFLLFYLFSFVMFPALVFSLQCLLGHTLCVYTYMYNVVLFGDVLYADPVYYLLL